MFELLEIIIRSLGLKDRKTFLLILLVAGLAVGLAVWISVLRPQ